jgi:uncharacterized membrane protein
MSYLLLKYWHILSAFLLFGTGLGSAFYKWMADRSGNVQHIAITNRHVVFADYLFTTPTVIMQPLTGIWMASLVNLPLTTPWIAISLGLYIFAGCCWLPVVYLQINMQKIAEQAVAEETSLPARYWQLARLWFWLGVPAFLAMLAVVFLMVYKHIN